MKYFTKSQIEEIRKQLATLGIRDTDLPYASEMTGEELIAIVQDGINKKVGIADFFLKYLPEDFLERIVRGESAYEIARRNGFPGTEQEWLASLKGAKGDKGADGAAGQKGADGAPGPQGPVGPAGVTSATARINSSDSQLGVTVTLANSNLDFVFSGLNGGGGGGGEEGGGTPGPKGDDGRSVTSIDYWYKVSQYTNITSPDMSISDPSTFAGGSWSKTAGSPTEQLPYLWSFVQINYDQPLATGYMYSRSSAYIVRRYNNDSSVEYDQLEALINELRADMDSSLSGYDTTLTNLSSAVNAQRQLIEQTILTDLSSLGSRISSIDASEVKTIEENGVWGVITSYSDDTNGQKSFSDIVLDSKKAKNTLSVGSQFFGTRTGAELTLDGIKGQLDLRATKQYVDSAISTAQFSVDPAALQSVIAKGQTCWIKDGVLYPYTYHIDDGDGFTDLTEYEAYMETPPGSAGPSDGPFTLVVEVEQFSSIKQTVDSISAGVNSYKYMWESSGGLLYDYNYFADQYDERSSTYDDYTYEAYVGTVLGYTRVEVGDVLSDITQTSSEVRALVGVTNKVWRKNNGNGTYSYQRYALPENSTKSQYETSMTSSGWSLYDYSEKFSVIDQTDNKIETAVKKASLVWINDSYEPSDEEYCYPYDQWYWPYSQSSFTDYEEYVAYYHSDYELVSLTDSISDIKQTADSITSVVEQVNTLGGSVSAVQQTAEQLSVGVSTLQGDMAGLTVKSNKIWAGIGDGNDVSASITLLAGLDTNQAGSKVILDADTVEVNGELSAGIVNAGLVNASAVLVNTINEEGGIDASTAILPGSITTELIDTDSLVAKKVRTSGEAGTLNTLIQNGMLSIYLGPISSTNLALNRRVAFGIEGNSVVLKFFDADGNLLYDLGPNGIQWATDGSVYRGCQYSNKIVLCRLCSVGDTLEYIYSGISGSVRDEYYVFTPASKSSSGGAAISHYYYYDELDLSSASWESVSSSSITPYVGILVRTNHSRVSRPEGANVEIPVWPETSISLTDQIPADGWYLDNTDGFLANYKGVVEQGTPEEEEAAEPEG